MYVGHIRLDLNRFCMGFHLFILACLFDDETHNENLHNKIRVRKNLVCRISLRILRDRGKIGPNSDFVCFFYCSINSILCAIRTV